MNHVELSGLIAEPVVAHKVNEQIVHAEFQLQTRHKNRAGEWQKERYTIHCWNRLAEWVNENLHQGDLVAVDGRLTQRNNVAIAAREIVLGKPANKKMPAEQEKGKGNE